MNPENAPQTPWPAVPFAYDFVIPSYQWAITRFEAVDSRIQTLQAFIVTVTLGVLAIATMMSSKMTVTSWWFISAFALAIVAVIIGVIGRSWGGIFLVDPSILYNKWLHDSEWDFKKDMVFFAGEHFEQNSNVVTKKAHIVTVMTALFLIETSLLVLGIILTPR